MVALALLCRDGTDGSAAAGLRRGGGVLDGMVSLCSRTGCRYMRNPAYGSAVAGTAERARAETLSGTSEACLSALPSETKKPLKTAAFSLLVPRTRLELTRRKPALPPQSSVSTNSTTWASAFAERSGSNHAYEPVSPKGCANRYFSFNTSRREKKIKKIRVMRPAGGISAAVPFPQPVCVFG